MNKLLILFAAVLLCAIPVFADSPVVATSSMNSQLDYSNNDNIRSNVREVIWELDEQFYLEDWEGEIEWEGSDALAQGDIYWQPSDYEVYEGDYSWRCFDEDIGAFGGYLNHWLQWMMTPEMDLTQYEVPIVSFYFRLIIEEPAVHEDYDGWDTANMWVFYGDDEMEVVAPTTGIEYNITSSFAFGDEWFMGPDIPGWGSEDDHGPMAVWSEVTVDLTDYTIYDNVRFVWAFCSDPAYDTNDNDDMTGFQVDNISIMDGDTELFADDCEDAENTELEFLSGLPDEGIDLVWEIVEDDDAPSPTHILQDTVSAMGYNHYWTSPDIDLSDVVLEEGEELQLDVMIRGGFSHPDDNANWTAKVYSYTDDVWYYATNVNRDLTNYVFIDMPPEWGWYSDSYANPWVLNEVAGHVIRVRLEYFAPITPYDTFEGVFFDDVVVQTIGAEFDVGLEPLSVPFPTTVGYPTLCEATFVNLGMNEWSFNSYFNFNGDNTPYGNNTLQVGEDLTLVMDPDPDDEVDEWVPTEDQIGENFFYARILTADDDGLNNQADTVFAEVLPENIFELGYDDRNPQFTTTRFALNEGPLTHFSIPEDIEKFNLDSLKVLWNGNLGIYGVEEADVDVHVFAGGETPGEEIYSTTVTVTPDITNPFWHVIDVSGTEAFQDMSGDFWVWYEFVYQFEDNVLPEIVLSSRVWGDERHYEYDGETLVDAGSDWMMRVYGSIEDIDDVVELGDAIPAEYSLAQAYPNPFNPSTSISFNVPRISDVQISVFNLVGQEVARVVDGNLKAGTHTAVWNAEGMASGVYFFRMNADGFNAVRKVMLLK